MQPSTTSIPMQQLSDKPNWMGIHQLKHAFDPSLIYMAIGVIQNVSRQFKPTKLKNMYLSLIALYYPN